MPWLRIPMRGYEIAKGYLDAGCPRVTNPHEGL